MNPSRPSLAHLVLIVITALVAVASAAGDTVTRPNFILFVTDDQRWDAISANNPDLAIRTPHIDRLAAQGVNFTSGFVTTPICAVSRASILSGRYSRNVNVHQFLIPPSDEAFAKSYPAQLKRAGYYLGQLGKYGVGATGEQRASFDLFDADLAQGPPEREYEGRQLHDSEWLSSRTRDFLEQAPRDRPFCLQVNFKAPHPSSRVAPEDVGTLSHLVFDRLPTDNPVYFAALPGSARRGLGNDSYERNLIDEESYNNTYRTYLEKLLSVDRAIGRILGELRALGLAENTVILFTSDHGTHFGEKQLAGKWTPYEQSLRVPFIIYDPRAPEPFRGRSRSEIVLNIDLAPTLLDLAGLPIPQEMDGRSLAPLLRGESSDWRSHFFFEHQTSPVGVTRRIARNMGVRTLTEKYIRWTDESPRIEEFYDLPADPWEVHNLVANPMVVARVDRLRTLFEDWERSNPNTYDHAPYGPRPQANAPGLDWEKFKMAKPEVYQRIEAEIKALGITWEDARDDPELRAEISDRIRYFY